MNVRIVIEIIQFLNDFRKITINTLKQAYQLNVEPKTIKILKNHIKEMDYIIEYLKIEYL